MLAALCSFLLSMAGPVLKFLASKAPDKVLEIIQEVGPVVDALQAQAAAEAAARKAKK